MVTYITIKGFQNKFLPKNLILSKPKSTAEASHSYSVSCFILFHEKIIKPACQILDTNPHNHNVFWNFQELTWKIIFGSASLKPFTFVPLFFHSSLLYFPCCKRTLSFSFLGSINPYPRSLSTTNIMTEFVGKLENTHSSDAKEYLSEKFCDDNLVDYDANKVHQKFHLDTCLIYLKFLLQ